MSFSLSNLWQHVVGVAAASEQEAQKIAEDIITGAEVVAARIDSLFKYAAAEAPALAQAVVALEPLAVAASAAVAAAVPGGEAVVIAGDIAAVMAGAKQASDALTQLQSIQAQAQPGAIGAAKADAQSALALYQAAQSTAATVSAARATAIGAVTQMSAAAPAA